VRVSIQSCTIIIVGGREGRRESRRKKFGVVEREKKSLYIYICSKHH